MSKSLVTGRETNGKQNKLTEEGGVGGEAEDKKKKQKRHYKLSINLLKGCDDYREEADSNRKAESE